MEPAAIHARPASRVGARAIGGSAAAVWLLSLVTSIVYDGVAGFTRQGAVLGLLVVAAVTGVALAFRHEEAGGWATLVAGVALTGFALVTSGDNDLVAAIVAGGPFLLSGMLFLVAAGEEGRRVR